MGKTAYECKIIFYLAVILNICKFTFRRETFSTHKNVNNMNKLSLFIHIYILWWCDFGFSLKLYNDHIITIVIRIDDWVKFVLCSTIWKSRRWANKKTWWSVWFNSIVSWHLLRHAIKSVTCFDLQFWRNTRPMTSFCIFIAYINTEGILFNVKITRWD